jgi:hypothetical protein
LRETPGCRLFPREHHHARCRSHSAIRNNTSGTGLNAYQRDAQRSLKGLLGEAEQIGFAVFGGKRRMLLTGGVKPPDSWYRSVIYVVRKEKLPEKDNISLRVTWG